jgi:hypothetical protein
LQYISVNSALFPEGNCGIALLDKPNICAKAPLRSNYTYNNTFSAFQNADLTPACFDFCQIALGAFIRYWQ